MSSLIPIVASLAGLLATLFLGRRTGGPRWANRPRRSLVIAADRKNFSMKGAETRVWTFTPSLVQ